MLPRTPEKVTAAEDAKSGAQKRKEPGLAAAENQTASAATTSAVSSAVSNTVDKAPTAQGFFSPKRSRTDLAALKNGASPSKFKPDYPRLAHDFSIQAHSVFICDGGSRESILVDMNSAALQTYFTMFIEDLETNEASTQSPTDPDAETESKPVSFFINTQPSDFLSHLASFVNERFSAKPTENAIAKIVSDYHQSLDVDVRAKTDYVPLEIFIDKKMGFCRHHALAVSYLLVKLIEHIANINERAVENTKVYRYRSALLSTQGNSSHAVVVYEDEKGQRFFIDSTRKMDKELGVAALISPAATVDKATLKELESCYIPFDLVEFIASLNARYDALSASLTASSSSSSSSSSSTQFTFKK